MQNLTKRIITASILLFIVIFIVLQESIELTSGLVGLVLVFSFFEFVKMLKLQNKKQCVLMFFAFVIAPVIFAITGKTFALYTIFGITAPFWINIITIYSNIIHPYFSFEILEF